MLAVSRRFMQNLVESYKILKMYLSTKYQRFFQIFGELHRILKKPCSCFHSFWRMQNLTDHLGTGFSIRVWKKNGKNPDII